MTTAEKRKYRRIPMVTRIEADSDGTPYLAEARNISVGGILIHTVNPAPEGQVVRLKFTLPGTEQEIHATGTVLHVSPGAYMGVRFDELDPTDREAIQQFIEKA